MAEAGFPNGIDVEFLVIAREVDKLQAEMLKSMWDAIGLRTTVTSMERVALNQRLLTGGAPYDVTTTRGGSAVGDPDDEYRAHFWSNGNFAKARLKDPEIDERDQLGVQHLRQRRAHRAVQGAPEDALRQGGLRLPLDPGLELGHEQAAPEPAGPDGQHLGLPQGLGRELEGPTPRPLSHGTEKGNP